MLPLALWPLLEVQSEGLVSVIVEKADMEYPHLYLYKEKHEDVWMPRAIVVSPSKCGLTHGQRVPDMATLA